MALFEQSQMLADMAQGLIDDHYPVIRDNALRIAYMFKDEMPGKCGTCRKVGDQDRTLHGFDFVITLAKDLWGELEKRGDKTFQVAVLDHELAHVGVVVNEETGEPKRDPDSDLVRLRLVRHDVEEFESIIRRYGAYAADLRAFQRAFEESKNEGG